MSCFGFFITKYSYSHDFGGAHLRLEGELIYVGQLRQMVRVGQSGICSQGDVSRIHGKHREPDQSARVSAPGQLAQPSPRSPWSPQLQQVQTQGAEGPGETRGSEQGVLETPTARPWLTSGE